MEEGEEEEEDSSGDSDSDDGCGDREVWRAVRSAFASRLASLRIAPPLAARLSDGLHGPLLLECEWEDSAALRSLSLAARLRAGGPGAELRMDYHRRERSSWVEFSFSVSWRPLPAPPDARRRSRGWTRLARAHYEDAPRTGDAAVDENMYECIEIDDASGLTAQQVARLRAAVLGAGETDAALSDVALLELALTSCGALGLESLQVEVGHVWHPDAAQRALPLNAKRTSWLEHAVRAAAGAPAPADAHYKGFDIGAVKTEWGERVLEHRAYTVDDFDPSGSDNDASRHGPAVPAAELWDWVDAHGRLPWGRGPGSAFADVVARMLPPSADREETLARLRREADAITEADRARQRERRRAEYARDDGYFDI